MPGIQYTPNLLFPMLDDGGKSWGAVQNGINFDVDAFLNGLEVKTPIILTYENEVLVHEGDILKISNT